MSDTFKMQYKDDIQSRMVDVVSSVTDNTAIEGSFSRDIINANSVEFENTYAEMNLMIKACFADTSWGEYLTMRAAEYGVDRKDATSSIGYVIIKGQAGTAVPKGFIVSVKNGTQFTTNDDAVIGADGTVKVNVTASTTGSSGNAAAHTINTIMISQPGVSSVDNPEATHDGFDQESDADLLARYMQIVRTPATSGNKYHYYNWAMSVKGVGGCKVEPLWNGNGTGTVKVIIIDEDYKSASDDIVKRTQEYIDSVRPIGATVTVVSPVPLTMNITGDVVGNVNTDNFKKAIENYLRRKNLDLKYLSSAQVGNLLMDNGATDYDNLLLNGKTKLTVTEDQMLTVGTVTLNVIH